MLSHRHSDPPLGGRDPAAAQMGKRRGGEAVGGHAPVGRWVGGSGVASATSLMGGGQGERAGAWVLGATCPRCCEPWPRGREGRAEPGCWVPPARGAVSRGRARSASGRAAATGGRTRGEADTLDARGARASQPRRAAPRPARRPEAPRGPRARLSRGRVPGGGGTHLPPGAPAPPRPPRPRSSAPAAPAAPAPAPHPPAARQPFQMPAAPPSPATWGRSAPDWTAGRGARANHGEACAPARPRPAEARPLRAPPGPGAAPGRPLLAGGPLFPAELRVLTGRSWRKLQCHHLG